MNDSIHAGNVRSCVASVGVRVMMAVTMYIFELYLLRLLFLVDNMEMTEIDGEYAC